MLEEGFKTYTYLAKEPVTHLRSELLLLIDGNARHSQDEKVGAGPESQDRDTGSQILLVII